MNSIYEKFLGDLIELKNLKIVPGKKKKVITSSIFIPEIPHIKDKTYSYFVGLIKSIETFSESMPGWIYRLYIDELFVSGISPADTEDGFKSVYNNVSPTNNKASPYNYREVVKKSIKGNRGDLRKIQLLLNLFIKKILTPEDPQYKNIELVSFRCPQANQTRKYPGHSSTFGSIIRLFTMFDDDIDVSVSVNSRYPMNYISSMLINDFDQRPEKKMLNAVYMAPVNFQTRMSSFISDSIYICVYRNFIEIKSKETLDETDEFFVDVINEILGLKESITGIDTGLNFETLELDEKLFGGIQPIISKGMNLDLEDSYKINSSVAAGFFGIKKNKMFDARIKTFAKFLRYLILSQDEFLFGVDEILLKLILSPETGSMTPEKMDNGNIKIKFMESEFEKDYIDHLKINRESALTFSYPENENHTYLIDSEDRRLYHREFIGKDNHVNLTKLIGKDDLFDIGVYGSRSLFHNKDVELKPDTPIYKMFALDGEDLSTMVLNLGYLFASYNEYRKLFVFNSGRTTSNLKAIADVLGSDKYFNLVDIKKYPMGKIDEMLDGIISHFREDNNEPKMKKVILTKGEKEKIGRHSRIIYSYKVVEGPGKKRNTKKIKPKKRKPKKKKSKKKKVKK